MSSSHLFNKAPTPRITVYLPDGRGRDSYIASNNGGFFNKYYMNHIEERFPRSVTSKRLDLTLTNHPKRYFADGVSRDLYIFKENPSNKDLGNSNVNLPMILRTPSLFNIKPIAISKQAVSSPQEIKQNNHNSMIQKQVVNRLFYNSKMAFKRVGSPNIKSCKKQPTPILGSSSSLSKTNRASCKVLNGYAFSYPSSLFIKKNLMKIFFTKQNNEI